MKENPYLILGKRIINIGFEITAFSFNNDKRYSNADLHPKYNLPRLSVHQIEFYPSFTRFLHEKGFIDLNLNCVIVGVDHSKISKEKNIDSDLYGGFYYLIQCGDDVLKYYSSDFDDLGTYNNYKGYVNTLITTLENHGFKDLTEKFYLQNK